MDRITVFCERGHDCATGDVVWLSDDVGSRWVPDPDSADGLTIERQFLWGDRYDNERGERVAEFGGPPDLDTLRHRYAVTCRHCDYRVERVGATVEKILSTARDAGVSRLPIAVLNVSTANLGM